MLSAGKLPFVDYDKDLLNEIPRDIKIHSVPFFSLSGLRKRIKHRFPRLHNSSELESELSSVSRQYHRRSPLNILHWIKKRLARFASNAIFLLVPDQAILWLPLAIVKAFWLIKYHGISIILTTSPPNSSHLLGLIIKKIANVKWVADFRDPWFGPWFAIDESNIFYNHRFKIEKWMEKIVISSADRIITVSKGDRINLEKIFLKIGRSKFHVITNGYDQDDFTSVDYRPISNSKFVLTHMGYLYEQSADDFFDAVESLLDENDELKKNIEIRFVGHISESYKKRITKSSFASNFSLVGQLKHRDALQNIMYSDALLVLLGGNFFHKAEIPGKIFEYLASNKIILAITQKDGDTAKILIESGLGVIVEPGDSNSIIQILKKLYREKCERRLTREVNSDFLKQFERKTLTRKLSYILDEVLSENCKLSKN